MVPCPPRFCPTFVPKLAELARTEPDVRRHHMARNGQITLSQQTDGNAHRLFRMVARGLENRRALQGYRGFESHPFRQYTVCPARTHR